MDYENRAKDNLDIEIDWLGKVRFDRKFPSLIYFPSNRISMTFFASLVADKSLSNKTSLLILLLLLSLTFFYRFINFFIFSGQSHNSQSIFSLA